MPRTTKDVQDALIGALQDATEYDTIEDLIGADVVTYEEVGMLTHDAGFLIKLSDGAEFQVTIVQSRESWLTPGPGR